MMLFVISELLVFSLVHSQKRSNLSSPDKIHDGCVFYIPTPFITLCWLVPMSQTMRNYTSILSVYFFRKLRFKLRLTPPPPPTRSLGQYVNFDLELGCVGEEGGGGGNRAKNEGKTALFYFIL